MPRRRVPPRLPPGDRDRILAEEVLYLHSLWRLGPPGSQPSAAPAAGRKRNRKRRRHERAAAASEPQDALSEWALRPSPPASSPRGWPEAAASTHAEPPPSPGSLAHREALRAAAVFFSSRGSDDEDGSESEDDEDEEGAAGFFKALFERDAALRGHYERGWEKGRFACMACAAGRRKAGRWFLGCVALVQHAHTATRYGRRRRRAHRALAAIVCRVLGWNIKRLPSIVIDPRGTLGQALAAEATVDMQLLKENDDTGKNDSSSSDQDEDKEYIETGVEDSSSDGDGENKELLTCDESDDEKEAVEKGTENHKTTGDEEAIELNNSEKSVEKENKEEIVTPNFEEISKNEVLQNGTVQKVGANKDDSVIHGNNGVVNEQEIDKESSEQEENVIENKEERESTS